MFITRCKGKAISEDAVSLLKLWGASDEATAIASKTSFIYNPFDPTLIDSDYWGTSCETLLIEFHDFIREIVQRKAQLNVGRTTPQEKILSMRAIGDNGNIEEHYQKLEDLFTRSLDSLLDEEPKINARLGPTNNASPDPKPSRAVPLRAPKRDSKAIEDAESAERPLKRRSERNVGKAAPTYYHGA